MFYVMCRYNQVLFRGCDYQHSKIIRVHAHRDGCEKMVVNCLFDSAVERSFIREDVAHELSLGGETLLIAVRGFSGGKKSQDLYTSVAISGEGRGEDLPVHVILGVDYFLCMLGQRSYEEVMMIWWQFRPASIGFLRTTATPTASDPNSSS
ncbi:hypothetical protein T4B_1439 [Trichinella pseudospiralis]|uniref:Uncharacterized protein n=1 Tax=Trichinella pseudospiralis TaxID=6337 RepID=A0A0V1IYI2_TRIPS|nr:hypothetical protein T4B_1439 [Trichinella pseudospiralis]